MVRYGNTALHYACEEERLEEARMLLQAGASLEVQHAHVRDREASRARVLALIGVTVREGERIRC